MLLSRGVSNRRAVGSFICFTCAARARSSAAHCVVMGSHSLHTERPPCWEFVLASFAPRARKLGCALVCNGFWLGLKNKSQFLELVFGPFASHLAAHVVVMNSFSGHQKRFPFWSHSAAHRVVMSSFFGYQKWFPFWGHVLVPFARIVCFQITMDEGTNCGSNFGYHFWSPFWEPIAFAFL